MLERYEYDYLDHKRADEGERDCNNNQCSEECAPGLDGTADSDGAWPLRHFVLVLPQVLHLDSISLFTVTVITSLQYGTAGKGRVSIRGHRVCLQYCEQTRFLWSIIFGKTSAI